MARTGGGRGGKSNAAQTVTIQLRADTKDFVAGVTAAANSARNAANQAARERVGVISGMTRAEKAAYREAAEAAKVSAGSIAGVMERASRTASIGWRDYASAVKSSVSSAASAAGSAFKNSNFGSAVMYNQLTTGIRAAFSSAKDSVAGAFSSMADRGRSMVSSVGGYFRNLGNEARTLAKNILSNREALDHISTGAAIGGAALTAGFGYAVKQYADFDKAMSQVQAATHETAGNMNKLREAAMKAGADTKYSGSEAANGIEELAKAGVETKDILGGGLSGALSLAAAGNIEVGEAAELAATAMTQFGLKGSDIGHVADLLAAGAGKAQGSVGDLGYALKQSGLVAAQTGLSIEETTGTLAAFASAGLVGSDAGTSFKVMLQKLQNPSKEAAGLMAEYGISLYNAEGKFKGITAVAGDLKRGLDNLAPAQRDAALATIFGSDAVRAANVLYTQGQEGIQGWIDKTNDAGYAASTAAIQQDNLAGDIEKLGGAIDTIILSSSGGLSDFFRGLVQMATGLLDFMGKLPPSFLAVNLTVVGLTGVALLGVAAAAKFITAYQTMKATLASFSVSARTASASTQELAASTEGAAAAAASDSKLGKLGATLGKIAGTAALAAEGIVLFVSAANTEYKTPSLESMNSALKNAGGNLDQVNQKFKDMGGKATWAFLGLEDQVPKVNGLGEALVKLKADSGDALEGFSQWVSHTAGAKVGADALKEAVSNLDEALGSMYAENRGEAEKFFQSIVRETDAASEAQGRAKYTAQEYMQAFPKLKEAVENYASSLNVSLTDEEKYQVMLGEYPPKLAEAARAQDELKHSLEVQKNSLDEGSTAMRGLSGEAQEMAKFVEGAGSAVEDLDKGLKMLAGGFADSTKSMADYYKSMDDLSEAIQKNSAAYDGQTRTFDQTTKAGQKLNDAFAKMAQEGIQASSAVARQGGDYEAVKAHIHGVIDTLRQSALQMGLTSDEAEQLIHSIYAIPDRVDINTWADTTAARVMTSLNNDIERMPREVTIGTQVFGVDAATGKLKYLREVSDASNGSVNIVAHADTEQATSALNGVINSANSIPAWTNTTASANTGQAFGQLGALANKANSVPGRVDTTANARTGVANSNINNYKNNLNSIPQQKTTTITQIFERKMVDSVKKTLGRRGGWRAHGGMVPGFASGGLIPGREPLSRWTDNVPAVTDAGSPLMVRSGEFIVNADATRKHRGLLERINSGDFVRGFSAGGAVSGRREFVAPAQAPDLYNQIVDALSNWAPMVNIDGRQFYGVMRYSTVQARR